MTSSKLCRCNSWDTAGSC